MFYFQKGLICVLIPTFIEQKNVLQIKTYWLSKILQ